MYRSIISAIVACFMLSMTPLASSAKQRDDIVGFGNFQRVQMHCPKPDELKRNNKRIWYKPNSDWKSYNPSFSPHIESFMGAQWQGVNVGRVMICRYRGSGGDFSVDVQMTNSLIPEPKGAGWTEPKKGVKNCAPNGKGVKNCPFKVLRQKDAGDPYDQIKYYKDK